jgi:hypothetical protein
MTATLLGIPGDVVAVVLGVLMFALLLALLEGLDRI